MDSSRLKFLSVCLALFVLVTGAFIWRTVNFKRTHFAVGQVPPEVAARLLPKDIPLSAMRPPAIRAGDPVRYGNATSVISVIEYGDYECEFCRAMAPVIEQVLPRYGGRVRFVWREFPIEDKHPDALEAAAFARCAGLLGNYWGAYDGLMARKSLSESSYRAIAAGLNVDTNVLDACRKDEAVIASIRKDREESQADGVKGVPFLFVGTKAFDRGLDAAALTQAIDDALGAL